MSITVSGRDWSCALQGRVEIGIDGSGIDTVITGDGILLHVRADQLIDATTGTPPGGWHAWTPRYEYAGDRDGAAIFKQRDEYASPGGCTVSGPYPVEAEKTQRTLEEANRHAWRDLENRIRWR